MTRLNFVFFVAALGACLTLTQALASLAEGAKAPQFTAQASLAGNIYPFSLADALKKGPVILYFYPAAFTPGCTVEAHDFAEATDRYKALGATVIGISHDSIETLQKFSVSDCRSKFAVAADPDLKIAKAYDSILAANPEYANRTSYVIAPDGTIVYRFTDLSPGKHVANTLDALTTWKARQPG